MSGISPVSAIRAPLTTRKVVRRFGLRLNQMVKVQKGIVLPNGQSLAGRTGVIICFSDRKILVGLHPTTDDMVPRQVWMEPEHIK